MSKKLPYLLTCFFAALSVMSVRAQEYQPLPIASGYNADVIANGTGAVLTTTTHGVDALYSYIATDFKATASSTAITYGVPVNGVINSLVTPGLSYQLGPLTGNNSLRMAAATTLTGTLTLTTPKPVVTLYILGVTGGANGTVSGNVTFTDNSTQSFTNLTVADWYNGTSAAVIGLGRVNRADNGLDAAGGTNPRMYQIPVSINAANQAKLVKSVTFTRNTTASDDAVNIFALSADVVPSCPSVTNVTATSGLTTGVVSWTPAVVAPAIGYDVYYSTSSTTPTATTTPNETVASTTSSYYLSGLTTATNYYFWVRSNCSATDKGIWRPVTFRTEVSATYTGGDLNTRYESASTVSPNSTTPCAGTLTITIPAGYKIGSIATSYNMTAQGGGWMSEQKSQLVCVTNGNKEATLASGASNAGGTFTYNRTNLAIANDLTGSVTFELRSWRTYGGSECTVDYNKVDNGTWKVIPTLVALPCTEPAAPTGATQNVCPGVVVGQLKAAGVAGAQFTWYNAPTGGSPLAASFVLTTGTYYATQTVGTCTSQRSAAIQVNVGPLPAPATTAQNFCGLKRVSDLVATGTSGAIIKWYAAATGGSPLASTTVLATGTYYASQTFEGCESATRAQTAVTTAPLPTILNQFFCSSATVSNFVATGQTGGTFLYYTAETGGSALAPATAIGTAVYYVTQTIGTCESARVAFQATVGTIVNPTVYPQELCPGATVANLQASGSTDATYKWFANASDSTPLAATTPVVSGTYYVSQTLGNCESGRSAHTVTINVVAVPVIADQTLCAASLVSNLEANVAEGDSVNWYISATESNPLAPNAVLTSGTYYATHKHNNCESTRVAVQVTINAPTPAPSITDVSVCVNSTVADLAPQLAEGATAKWYATATSVNPLAATVAANAGTLYLSQTINGCEGPRASVAIIIAVVPAPIGGEQTACTGSTFGDVAIQGAEGATFKWYTTETGNDFVANTDEVIAGTYFVSQIVNGCEGSRSNVGLVTSAITLPTPQSLQYFCGSATVADLDAGLSENATANWFNGNGDPITANTALANGTYTISQRIGICESEVAAVLVTINPIPSTPTGDDTQDFVFGDNLSHFVVEATAGATLKWYILVEGEWQSIPNGTILVDGNTYGVSQTINGCESDIFSIDANQIEVVGTDTFDIKNLMVYPNPSADVVNIEANETISNVVVYNLLGQEVIRQNVNATNGKVTIASLPQATYVMQIHTEGGASATLKVVKK